MTNEDLPSQGITCPFCGKPIEENTVTCPHCGKEIPLEALEFEDIDVPLPPVLGKDNVSAQETVSSMDADTKEESFIPPMPPTPPLEDMEPSLDSGIPNPSVPFNENEAIPSQQPMNDLPPAPSIPVVESTRPKANTKKKPKISKSDKESLLKSLADLDLDDDEEFDENLNLSDLEQSFQEFLDTKTSESAEEHVSTGPPPPPPPPPHDDEQLGIPVPEPNNQAETESIPHLEVKGLPPSPFNTESTSEESTLDSMVPPLPTATDVPPPQPKSTSEPQVEITPAPPSEILQEPSEKPVDEKKLERALQSLEVTVNELTPNLPLPKLLLIPLYWAFVFVTVSITSIQLINPEVQHTSLYVIPSIDNFQVQITIFLFPLIIYFTMGWYTRYQSKTKQLSLKAYQYYVIPLLVILYDYLFALIAWYVIGTSTNAVVALFTIFIYIIPVLSFIGGGWLVYLLGLRVGHEWYLKVFIKLTEAKSETENIA